MSHEKLKWMKDSLICVVENQLCNLNEVDTEELGDAIDMIKDLEEAIYYCTVTEAMKGNGTEIELEMKKGNHLQEQNGNNRMYYNGNGGHNYMMPYSDDRMYARRRRADGTFYSEDGRNYADSGEVNSSDHSYNNNRNYMDNGNSTMWRDEREGRSYNSRRMYMEAKDMKKDKATQLRELEKYMQELSQDIVEMIADSSPEEKQYLEKKITALASKIEQMK